MPLKLLGRLNVLDVTVLWIVAPLLVGGLIAAALESNRLAMRGPRGLRPRRSLTSLRSALVGKRKEAIASALGPPRTVIASNDPASSETAERPRFLDAGTWYYALDDRDRSAMAIKFDNDLAQSVEFFQSRQA